MTETPKANVSKVILERLKVLDNLPHFPSALMKLERLLSSDEEVHLDEVANLVSQDPRLTAGVIGVVNSARYSVGEQISSLDSAVGRIGTKEVRMMAHAINYKGAIKVKPPFSEKEFMKNAMRSAFIAQCLAKELHFDQGEAFLCGLMHDIGIYLLASENRDKYKKVMAATHSDVHLLMAAEQKVFGTSHAVMGARLLQQWRFPKPIIMGVAGHHAPDKVDPMFQNYAYLTYLVEFGSYHEEHTNGVVTCLDEEPGDGVLTALEFFGMQYDHYQELVEIGLQQAADSGLA